MTDHLALFDAGLVSRTPDENDRRASRLHLTPDGRRASAAGSATSEQWPQGWFSDALGDSTTARLSVLAGSVRLQGPGRAGVA